jgi:hypothetical protein
VVGAATGAAGWEDAVGTAEMEGATARATTRTVFLGTMTGFLSARGPLLKIQH